MRKMFPALVILVCTLLFSAIIKAQSGTCAECQSFQSQKIYLEKSDQQIIWIDASLFEFKINDKKEWGTVIKVHSYAKNLHFYYLKGNEGFRIENPSAINISIDNENLQTQSVSYSSLRERIVNNERKGFIGFKPQIVSDKIIDEKGLEVTGTLGELISFWFSLNEFRKFASAKKIRLKLDKKEYSLNKDQIKDIALVAQKIYSNKL